ncbi:alpha/beta hydrolase [bacterium]|jgi:uncharacterized protein|nr:alpha/beta hydrolase [Planctomicrobium sp.]MDB4731273.1 alpha/beta hydrolase [bacterium]
MNISNSKILNVCWIATLPIYCFACSGSPIQVSPKSFEVAQISSSEEISEEQADSAPEKISKVRTIDELLLFQPSKYPQGNWEPTFLNYQDVYFDSSDGTRIHAWYCPAKEPVAVMLYLHGNGGNLSGRARLMKQLQEHHRVSVMIVDYRGYGRSAGKATAEGAIQDAKAAREKLAELASVEEKEIVLMGRSLGGAIAIQLASEQSPKGLIIESSFTSLKAIAKHHFPKLAWLVPSDKLQSEIAIKKNQAPLLISHGNRDRVIPYKMGEKLFNAANDPKEFITIPNSDHNDPQSREYYKKFDLFLSGLNTQ